MITTFEKKVQMCNTDSCSVMPRRAKQASQMTERDNEPRTKNWLQNHTNQSDNRLLSKKRVAVGAKLSKKCRERLKDYQKLTP